MKRSEARKQAFVLIFQQSINHDTIDDIIEAAGLSSDLEVDDFARRLAKGAESNAKELDEAIEKHILGWKMARLSKVSLAILRLAIYEIIFEEKIPVSVSINEAVDLAKKYGGSEDAPYVNGVLGSVARGAGDKPGAEEADA